MFLRIKKKKNSGRDSYSFMLVENNRINGKVKQKVVKYLTSYTELQIYKEKCGITAPSISWIDQLHIAKLRIYFWTAIYVNLKDFNLGNKKKEIINKIREYIPIPIQEDFEVYVKQLGGFYKDKEAFINGVNERAKAIYELIS